MQFSSDVAQNVIPLVLPPFTFQDVPNLRVAHLTKQHSQLLFTGGTFSLVENNDLLGQVSRRVV